METFAQHRVNLRPGQHFGMAQHGDDAGVYVEFYNEPVEIPFKSAEAGHPVFEDVAHVRIRFPGDSTKVVVRPVRMEDQGDVPADPRRWPHQWAAFVAQAEQTQAGMPITEWSVLTRSMAMTLKAINIHTVEQLAAVADHALTWMGAREQRDKARAWLAQARDGAEAARLAAENQTLRNDIEMLKQQVKDLADASSAKKRG